LRRLALFERSTFRQGMQELTGACQSILLRPTAVCKTLLNPGLDNFSIHSMKKTLEPVLLQPNRATWRKQTGARQDVRAITESGKSHSIAGEITYFRICWRHSSINAARGNFIGSRILSFNGEGVPAIVNNRTNMRQRQVQRIN
jgi:hypothetical protein